MNILKKFSIYFAAFWYAWRLPYEIKRSKLPVPDYLEKLCRSNKDRQMVSAEEIYSIVSKISRFSFFHRRQPCMASSMALLRLLSSYGYSPYLVVGIRHKREKRYSCHCEVLLEEHLNEETLQSMKIIKRAKCFVMTENTGPKEENNDG